MERLEGQDIVAFTYADWHASWSTPQQIVTRLAPDNRVLFVDQPRSFLYGLKPRDPQGAGVWQGPPLQEVRPNLHVLHLPHIFLPTGKLPVAVSRQTLRLNGLMIARHVKRAILALGMHRPILWNFSPLHGTAAPMIDAEVTIYDICDEWVNYVTDRGGRALLEWMEDYLMRTADLVFVGTEKMAEKRVGVNPELHVVHHAADYQHFSQAASPATVVPEDLAALPKPVAGYVGVIDPHRFDGELIVSLARAHPEWSFALVGPARADMDLFRLKSCTNVYLLGNRPVEELPAYLKGMDVALIPYLMNVATANIYPLKLQEYLAASKPVVSTPLPAVLPYGEHLYLAEGADAFGQAIAQAMREDSEVRQAARQAVARANSWEHRVAEKSAHVIRMMSGKSMTEGANVS